MSGFVQAGGGRYFTTPAHDRPGGLVQISSHGLESRFLRFHLHLCPVPCLTACLALCCALGMHAYTERRVIAYRGKRAFETLPNRTVGPQIGGVSGRVICPAGCYHYAHARGDKGRDTPAPSKPSPNP